MATIRTTCPACGQGVDLEPRAIEVDVVSPEEPQSGEFGRYSFSCPACDVEVTKPADRRAVRLLVTGGAHVRSGRGGHPEDPTPGPDLTLDDLLDLHLLLQTDHWFDDLLASTR